MTAVFTVLGDLLMLFRPEWTSERVGGLLAELARLVETVGLVCILRRLGTGCN